MFCPSVLTHDLQRHLVAVGCQVDFSTKNKKTFGDGITLVDAGSVEERTTSFWKVDVDLLFDQSVKELLVSRDADVMQGRVFVRVFPVEL